MLSNWDSNRRSGTSHYTMCRLGAKARTRKAKAKGMPVQHDAELMQKCLDM